MKKTSNHTSSRPTPNAPASTAAIDLNPELPIIRIVSEEEEMHVKLGLEMEDSTHDMLVKWGKELATDEDYIEIAVQAGLREYADSVEE